MKSVLTIFAGVIFGVAAVTACQTAAPPQEVSQLPAKSAAPTAEQDHTDDAPRITLADAKKDFDAGNAVFIDTRSEGSYKIERIKGAINIMPSDVDKKIAFLPKGKKLIAYCS